MLDLKFVRENTAIVEEALRRRRSSLTLDGFVAMDKARRERLVEVEGMRAERNTASEEIGRLRRGKEDASELMERMKALSTRLKEAEAELPAIERKMEEFLLAIPNVPDPSVPDGAGEGDNPVVRTWGTPRAFTFPVKDHVDLGAALDILDFDRAAKIAGGRFCLSKGAGALMERALVNFMLDVHTREQGYLEVLPPFMANSASFFGTGQLPKFEEDLFRSRVPLRPHPLDFDEPFPPRLVQGHEAVEGEGGPALPKRLFNDRDVFPDEFQVEHLFRPLPSLVFPPPALPGGGPA